MSDETAKPGAPPPLTDAQELLVLAQRLDGFMEWLGGPNHTGWHHIQDMPDKIRDLARKQLLAVPDPQPGQIVRDAATGATLYCIAPGKLVPATLEGHQTQNPPRPLASGSGTANTPGNENASPEPPQPVHYHVTEVTGVMGVSKFTNEIPCSQCDWGHPPAPVLDMRSMLRRTPVPDFEPDLDTEALFQAGRPIL